MLKCQWDRVCENFNEIGARCDRNRVKEQMFCEVHLQRLCIAALQQARPREPGAAAKFGRELVLRSLAGVGGFLAGALFKHYWPMIVEAVNSFMIHVPPAGAEGTDELTFRWGEQEIDLLSPTGWEGARTVVVRPQLGLPAELVRQLENGDGWTAVGRILEHLVRAEQSPS
ncbi:hypothetical protein [Nannocystis punicea]|uniref:Uncharacterized protein n=1 Tax=Nannocystis punicea TaxID=2995304 RepID=A0ABY7H5Q4_9BACT|nr:hypothetical protein [Nannocystis poenicansa]WAS94611.1 hypothetical protein O0S08_00490 [Nannocystis poenicansa]